MMQLYCPACENVVHLESDAADEVLPCPSCHQPIYWLGRRKARPLSESAQTVPHIVAAPARLASPPHASSLPAPMLEDEILPPVESENWELECEPDVVVPSAQPFSTYFVALPYRAEGGVLLRRLPFFVVGMPLCGIGLGAIASVLGQTCYLILLYPLVVGMLLAAATILLCRVTHVRSPLLVGTVAFTAGAMALLTMHFLDYRRTLALVESAPSRLPQELAYQLQLSPGLLNYLQATAREGLTISGNEAKGLNLGFLGTYLYWGLEVLIVVLIASLGGAAGARDPYCSRCQRWKEERFLGTLADGGEEQRRRLERGHLSELTNYRPSATSGPLVFTASVCPDCGCASPLDLLIERNPRVRLANDATSLPLHLTYPGEALPVLEQVFTLSERSKLPLAG